MAVRVKPANKAIQIPATPMPKANPNKYPIGKDKTQEGGDFYVLHAAQGARANRLYAVGQFKQADNDHELRSEGYYLFVLTVKKREFISENNKNNSPYYHYQSGQNDKRIGRSSHLRKILFAEKIPHANGRRRSES